MRARVYVPLTLRMLGEYVAAGEIPSGTERVLPRGEDEDAEYTALCDAADSSAALVGREDVRGRRVVAVAETAAPSGPIPMHEVVAVHADTTDVDPYDEDPVELAWFATQEIPDLLA